LVSPEIAQGKDGNPTRDGKRRNCQIGLGGQKQRGDQTRGHFAQKKNFKNHVEKGTRTAMGKGEGLRR